MELVEIIRKNSQYWPTCPIKHRIETCGNIKTTRTYNEYWSNLESTEVRNTDTNQLIKYETYSSHKYIINRIEHIKDDVYHITEKYIRGSTKKPLIYKEYYGSPREPNNILAYRRIKRGEYIEYHLDRDNLVKYKFNYENDIKQGFQYTYAKTGKLIRIEYYWNGKNLTTKGRTYSTWPKLDEMQLMHLKLSV